jgi:uncharacterized membrane protein YuzA (DUF378 family)
MSWTLIAYILVGLFAVLYVLPKVIWWTACRIDQYIHSSTADSSDETLKDRQL